MTVAYIHRKQVRDVDLMPARALRQSRFIQSARVFAPSDELLDIRQIAARLGIPKSTVYELTRARGTVRHSHPLPHFKIGRRLRFNWSRVLDWITELEKEGVA